ncbi:hypothetical protein CRENBAI_017119 [Crenichthys baileyi]|uniref:Uncharacterized protein n=1 Tax=Crenichthys baileyi TaxID=28760 RepID=A0AAV9SBC3_9TELE
MLSIDFCPLCHDYVLLYNLIARETKEFLSMLVELGRDSSLPLNTLLCVVLCRGCWTLSSMDSSLAQVFFSATVTGVLSSVSTNELALLASLSVLMGRVAFRVVILYQVNPSRQAAGIKHFCLRIVNKSNSTCHDY